MGALTTGLIFCFFILTIYEFLRRRKLFMARKRLGLSGPTPDYFTGNIKDMIIPAFKQGLECTPFISYNFFKKYGKTYAINFGINPMQISTVDTDIIREVFIKQFSNFVDREDTNEMFSTYPLGESLLQIKKIGSNGYGWKDIRSVVSPVFTTGKMKQMHFIMQERIEVLLNILAGKCKNGNPIDIYDEFQALTLDVIGRTAFGIDSDSLNDRTQQFYVESRDFFNRISLTGSLGVVLGFLSSTLCRLYRPFSTLNKIQNKLANDLKQVILYRKKHIDDYKKIDLIQLLLKEDEERQTKENKPPMHIDIIVSNCFAFLLAGYETTSTALAFSAWLLAKHPAVQEKLYQEIKEKLGDITADYATVMKMTYLDAVFKECLRLKPPVVLFTARRCIQDTIVCGMDIKKNESVLAPVHAIHWNEDYWPDPFKFDPERFTNGKTYDPLTWVPFGIGPRNCVGLRFAELEYKTAIVEIVRRFKLQLHSSSETEIKNRISAIIMRPINGVILQLSSR